MSTIAGILGLVMFGLGFMRWLNVDFAGDEHRFSGFAFQMPTTAVIGLSLAAGLICLLALADNRRGRGVPTAIPTGLAATALLLAVGIFLGKGAISPSLGDEVGVEIGLILAIITAALQTIVLGAALASRYDDSDRYDDRYLSDRTQR